MVPSNKSIHTAGITKPQVHLFVVHRAPQLLHEEVVRVRPIPVDVASVDMTYAKIMVDHSYRMTLSPAEVVCCAGRPKVVHIINLLVHLQVFYGDL